MTEWSFQAIHDALLHLAEAQGLKNGRIMWPVRVAVSGKATTPGGAVELCHILGKEETLRRSSRHPAADSAGMSCRFCHASQRESMFPKNALNPKWYDFCPYVN